MFFYSQPLQTFTHSFEKENWDNSEDVNSIIGQGGDKIPPIDRRLNHSSLCNFNLVVGAFAIFVAMKTVLRARQESNSLDFNFIQSHSSLNKLPYLFHLQEISRSFLKIFTFMIIFCHIKSEIFKISIQHFTFEEIKEPLNCFFIRPDKYKDFKNSNSDK